MHYCYNKPFGANVNIKHGLQFRQLLSSAINGLKKIQPFNTSPRLTD